ncbi:carboxypeptidase regulatory-like domain-containing protein [Sphingomonas sp.]|uniref:TonB-dependent receptor n=1 Tax=Sphingomonas sp. TaxID=28214 RepID=UPI0035BC83D6
MRNNLFLGVAAVALMVPAGAFAQETTAQIRGTVTNAGAPVAGATVVTTDVASGTRSQTTSGADGGFTVAGLRPGGPYSVEVTSAVGNKTVTDIFTVVQQPFTLPIDLAATTDAANAADAAGAGEDIVVTASSIVGAGVRSNGPQTVLTQADIQKVASVNRDVRDIVRRDPFATLDLSNNGERGGAVSIAGVNPRFNRFTINGVQVGDSFGLNQDSSPTGRGPVPFDALAQVSVAAANFDFRQGNYQGGAIDTVLLSGTNEFHGTGFYSQNRDELQGDKSDGTNFVIPNFKSETYGATLRGPLVKDTLFFMVSAERNTDPRPFATQASQVPGLTSAAIASVVGTANTAYKYNPGGVLTINNRKDEKIVGRIDWNVTDGQRLSVSYINAYDALDSQNNTSTGTSPSYGLQSNAYSLTELLRAGIVQLNSDWTDNFSTEVRGLYKSYKRGQEPLLGRGFAQFRVCTDAATLGSLTACTTGATSPTVTTGSPVIAFGPDNNRQTNELNTKTYGGSVLSRLRLNNHELKMLAEFNENSTFNNFVPNSLGNYYFDSLADYQAGRANTLAVAVPISGDPNGAAADFHYDQWTFGVQDDWQVTDTLQFSYGFRWDLYGMRGAPVANPSFLAREGFRNTKTYKGLEIFQPRASFNWKPVSQLTIRGGGGIFGGGSPDIYLSNSYSNTVTTNAVTFTRAASAALPAQIAGATCTGNVPAAVCNAALNGVTGQIPQAVSDYVRGGSTNALTNTGALDPNFKLPSAYKGTLSADYDLFGITFGADYYFSAAKNQVIFTDARSVVIGTLPDGRPRYNSLAPTGFADVNYDILTTNTGKGRTHIGVVRFDKQFDWGLQVGGSYSLQDVRDVSPATSSTINSNYQNQFFADPNRPALGTSSDQIKWQFKYSLGYDHAFFGDYRTKLQLFGETRAGRPYSYVMQNNVGSNRSPVSGTILNSAFLLPYVPTSTSDPIVSYDSTATATAFDTFINGTALNKYRGQIAPKNIARSKSFTRIDLHVEQELPTFVGGSKVSVFADVNNLLNLIDSDWGALKQYNFSYNAAVVQVQCLQGAVPTGTAAGAVNPAGGTFAAAATTSTQPCAQYRYSGFATPNDKVTNVTGSLYAIRIGARFTF